MKKINFSVGESYHICNRGVLGIKIFNDIKDYIHFLACLKEFNTTKHIDFRILHLLKKAKIKPLIVSPEDEGPLVELIAYCLLPNHFHIIVKEVRESGIPLFMQKLGTGYTMYFQKRHKIKGHLFQGRFSAQHIQSFDQLLFTSAYVHLNPIKRKEEQLFDIAIDEATLQKIKHYPWSSMRDYSEDPSLLSQDLPELKHAKPPIKKEVLTAPLGKSSYESFISQIWKREKFRLIDKKLI